MIIWQKKVIFQLIQFQYPDFTCQVLSIISHVELFWQLESIEVLTYLCIWLLLATSFECVCVLISIVNNLKIIIRKKIKIKLKMKYLLFVLFLIIGFLVNYTFERTLSDETITSEEISTTTTCKYIRDKRFRSISFIIICEF